MAQEADTICLLFLSDSDQRILEYGCSYHTMYIYVVSNFCLSIFTCRWCMRECWKNIFWGTGMESPGNFSEQKNGNLGYR